jgi:hypothetical protein
MSDSWTPIHHEALDEDELGSTQDPRHENKPRDNSSTVPVGLTLALPRDMINAMWGAAEQLKRVALAIEENTKEITKLAASQRET